MPYFLGRTEAALNQFAKAVKEYNIALNREPKNPIIHIWLGYSYLELNRRHEANRCAQQAVSISPEIVTNADFLGLVEKLE